ncbi:unnamed protein product [Bursaphelenchus xylophilus]|nr:unnamed protein product [Bursaphelenchus xylophilus]CAG9121191.1 unnamed protein product [Bursaphelenchus xylophilus]
MSCKETSSPKSKASSLNLQPVKIFEVGDLIYGDYKVTEVMRDRIPSTHNFYKAKAKKPFKDQNDVEYPELMFKTFGATTLPEVNVVRESQIHAWLKASRCPDAFFRILCPAPLIFGDAQRMLAFPIYHCSLAEVKRRVGFLSQKTTLRLGLEMLSAVKELHGLGIVHQNLNPGHFLLSHAFEVDAEHFGVVICDLAEAKVWMVFEEEVPLPFSNPQPPVDPHFCSVDMMDSPSSSRRDDLYSWFYTMASLRAKLPWEWLEPDEPSLIRIRKVDWRRRPVLMASSFCSDIHRLISDIFAWINEMDSRGKPRYQLFAQNLHKALCILEGKPGEKFEDSPIGQEFARPDCVDTPCKASNQDEEYKSLFDDYKYDVQFMFRRAEVGLPPEVKASLDEKYKPYVFSEDNAEVVKSAVLPKQQRKVKEKAVKQKEKEIIAKEKPRAPTNVQKRSDSSEVEPTRERKKYVVKPVIDVKKWERKMGRSRTTEWLVGNAVLVRRRKSDEESKESKESRESSKESHIKRKRNHHGKKRQKRAKKPSHKIADTQHRK